MKYLLDVNVLLAGLWKDHPRHAETAAWIQARTSCCAPWRNWAFCDQHQQEGDQRPMKAARELLSRFAAERIADDLPALDSKPNRSEDVTDHYLADLAARHGCRLATFDESIDHAAVEVIAKLVGPAPAQPGK